MSLNEQIKRVASTIDEAKNLSEYWTGTLHEQLIEQDLNALVEALHGSKEEVDAKLLTLQNTLALAREAIEKAENEN